ncbi:(2Fe-2S)-binding protein [Janibacter sp. Soil728]|uniref:(2Fe-2S)-binding protein n=1 Tax=Janibacter sp. Soil728 TaxID=1736393 RepID=UPI0006F32D47|nr:(2Fe-2S)-binding protein [Janibacter sp. Soil728]KRE38969.1 (2Fe-2S)-binding protein [Janibacter sp. Soil728]
MSTVTVKVNVNGTPRTIEVESRTSLADLLRDRVRLTGTHLGCEQGVCGSCTVLMDGLPVRSCLTLAASCDGAEVVTVEGLDDADAHRLRQHFSTEGALQCGFCTSGMLVTGYELVRRRTEMDRDQVACALAGNICRCTGYNGIIRAVQKANDDGMAVDDLT